jgi:hypothetical protein
MRLMTIVSLLQEWMEGTVAYHAAVHSELRSLEAIAAACDSMALLLLMQAVCNSARLSLSCNPVPHHSRISGRNESQSCSSGCREQPRHDYAELPRCYISGTLKHNELQPKSMNHDWRRSAVRRFFT